MKPVCPTGKTADMMENFCLFEGWIASMDGEPHNFRDLKCSCSEVANTENVLKIRQKFHLSFAEKIGGTF